MNEVQLPEGMEGFAFSASSEQARAFMAASSERVVAVACWALSRSTGQVAPEALFKALEVLWNSGPVDDEQVGEAYDELRELVDEGGGEGSALADLADVAADVAHTALGLVLGGDSSGVGQVAWAAMEFVAGLGERAGQELAARERGAQERDLRSLGAGAPPDLAALRATAAEEGRHYVSVAAAWYEATAGRPAAPSVRVTATVDRSSVLAEYANAVPHHGVVGRIVEGRDAGRYLRVDSVADLGWPEEDAESAADGVGEPEAEGVMIRVAGEPDITLEVKAEWVEDWPAVEEALERDGRRVDWSWRAD
ncbi:hypothetical protein ACQ86F_02805 [Streptomyces venezuelae ATCC 10712]